MIGDYRKIIVGTDLKNGFVWTIGQTVMGDFKVSHFEVVNDRVLVYIEKNNEGTLWFNYPLGIVSFQENI